MGHELVFGIKPEKHINFNLSSTKVVWENVILQKPTRVILFQITRTLIALDTIHKLKNSTKVFCTVVSN